MLCRSSTTTLNSSSSAEELVDYLSIDSYGVDSSLFEVLQNSRVRRGPSSSPPPPPSSLQQGGSPTTAVATTTTVFLKPDPNYSGIGSAAKSTLYSSLFL